MSRRRLVIDAGGTNVRFGVADDAGQLSEFRSYSTADHESFDAALNCYLGEVQADPGLGDCAIAAAGPVDNGVVRLTNVAWVIAAAEVSRRLGGARVALVNDLEAVAAALPHLGAQDIGLMGQIQPQTSSRRTMLAFNIGTGLGAAAAVWRGGRWWTCPSEAGHMTLGAVDGEELELLEPGGTVEQVLSGDGVVVLYRRIARRDGQSPQGVAQAADVLAIVGEDRAAARTVELITRIAGRVAGDLALASAAWGGVFLCGSVAAACAQIATSATFRAAFESKGPMMDRMRHVATAVIRRENVSLLGLAMMPVET